MPQVLVSSVVSLSNIDKSFQEVLRKTYTFTPRVPPGAPSHVRPPSVSLCKTYKDFFIVPRDLGLLQKLQDQENVHIVDAQDNVVSPPTSSLHFHGTLDASRNQPQAVAQCLEILKKTPWGGGCLLSLPPGFGKTACALYISAQIAKRALILVHTSVLAQQWKSRVETFLPQAVVRHVTSQNIPADLRDATHIIVLLQTVVALTKRGQLSWLHNLHDFMIVDETHHVCARTLCKVVETVGCRYRLGLSATIERKDGLDAMLSCLIGPLAFQCERHDNPNLQVHALRYTGNNDDSVATNMHGHSTFVAEVNEITRDDRRQALVLNHLQELYFQGRYIIVLSDRLSQLRDIQNSLLLKTIPSHMAIGGCTHDPDMEQRPVILATYAFASEGLDIPQLNTCVMASPRVDVKQSVGRILRSSFPRHGTLSPGHCGP